MKVAVYVQARMRSTRFPGKALAPLYGLPIIYWTCFFASKLRPDVVRVLTSEDVSCDPIVHFCRAIGVKVSRGAEDDVLSRFASAIKMDKIDYVVRLTADNPGFDLAQGERLISVAISDRLDYATNQGLLPIGLGIEVFSAKVLEVTNRLTLSDFHREHINEFILEKKSEFNSLIAKEVDLYSKHRCTIDTVTDLDSYDDQLISYGDNLILDVFREGSSHYYKRYMQLFERSRSSKQKYWDC